MAKGYYAELVALLKDAGWVFDRPAKGSHEMWVHSETGLKTIIPRNCKKKHLANSILKQAGLSKKF